MKTGVIKKPWITEKANALTKGGKYVFIVADTTTKNEVKKAIKDIYRVDVVDVNITNIPPKVKGLGAKASVRGGHKKAVITLKEGQKIDLI